VRSIASPRNFDSTSHDPRFSSRQVGLFREIAVSDAPGHLSKSSRMQEPSEGPAARLFDLWRSGQGPDLQAFLTEAGPLSATELTDVLCTDQRQRWLHGQRPEVDAYIAMHRAFHPGAEPALDLIFGEFLARRELGESPILDEYCRRAPELAGQLRLHVGLYDALGEVGPATESSASASGQDTSSASLAVQTPPVAAKGERPVSRSAPAVYPELPGYEILGEAGRGGMGIVYKARQLSLQRLVAIKVVPLGGNQQTAARFRQELLLAGRLAHPNLVAAYDADAVSGLPYFVMEFVEGIGLDALVRKRGPLPVADACEVVRQAALGLQHIHEHGLVHRDIKPSNLMLTPSGQVKVLDLGLARLAHESSQVGRITSSGQFLGTLDYMAPEQSDNSHAVDIRADIYSLGCTLHHLLAGGPPFAAFSSPYQKLRAHMERPAPSLREQRADVSELLAAALSRMLAKDRGDRFARPADVVAALQPFTGGADLPILLPANPVSSCAEDSGRPAPQAQLDRVRAAGPLLVGVLHSLSGTLVNSEAPVVDATLLAIEEINQRGGIRGRKVEVLVRDGQSDGLTFAREAERLIARDRVCTLFGCWLSACRKQVLPVVEKHNHLLIYPKTYEGLEQSPCIVCIGATPNQFILPAVRWAMRSLGKRRFFLMGLDQVYARVANAIIRDEVAALGGEIVGEEYLLMSSTEVADAVHKIAGSGPDMILNTLAGDRNVPFTRALRTAGVTADRLPTIHFSSSEIELRSLSARETAGNYAAWNYFQNLDRPENHAFVQRFRDRYGRQRVTGDPMEAAYVGVHLWAQGVEAADCDDPQAIRLALRGQSFCGPGGVVRIDPENQHTWKVFRLGKIVEDGQFEVIASSEEPIRPEPYAASRSPAAWNAFLADLQQRWDGLWANPGK
jgi:urea transport system substrate-binding protein